MLFIKTAIVNDSLGKRDEAIKLLKQLRANFKYAEITKAAQDKLKEWGVKMNKRLACFFILFISAVFECRYKVSDKKR